MDSGIPPQILVAEFERQWPQQFELTVLRLHNEALRRSLSERRTAEAEPDMPANVREALEEIGHL